MKYHYFSQGYAGFSIRPADDGANSRRPTIDDAEILAWFADGFPEHDLDGLAVEVAGIDC